MRVETRQQRQVVGQGIGLRVPARPAFCLLQAQDAGLRLAGSPGRRAVQPVEAGTRVRVHERQRRALVHQVAQGGNQHEVLEHVGVVARVERVAVTEHGAPW